LSTWFFPTTLGAEDVVFAIPILSPIWFMFQINIFSIIVVVTLHKLALIDVRASLFAAKFCEHKKTLGGVLRAID
jgi:hypothetical protein